MWHDEARRGRAGQAFKLGEPGVMNGTTANSLATSYRGPRQDGQVAKTNPGAPGCLRILDQSLGPTRARSRTNRPLEKKSPARWPGSLKGGLDIPFTHARCSSLRVERPLRTLARRVWSRTGRFGIRLGIFVSHPITVSFNDDRLPVMHQPVDQGRGQGVVRVTQGAPFPERSIRG